MNYELLRAEVALHPFPLLFASVSGAHLYGFPSPDSDYDLRGVHLLPLSELVGLLPKRETVQTEGWRDGIEMDLVTHDAAKFFNLLLKRNGYVLEQLYSPLVVCTTPAHEELREIAKDCITRHHSNHYLGFAATQWKLFEKTNPPRVKPLLYVYRVLLSGIHLMRTGQIEANLGVLNQEFQLPYIAGLIDRKINGQEKSVLADPEVEFHRSEFQRLVGVLEAAAAASNLPQEPNSRLALHDLLLRVRLAPAKLEIVTLYRPVGENELELIRASGWRAFPPRLPEQPIFYPVLTEAYAVQIARDWNTKNAGTGYVLRFAVDRQFLSHYEVRVAGAGIHQEYWIPAEDLPRFNEHIAGKIELIASFSPA
jgi:uncharacterized protein